MANYSFSQFLFGIVLIFSIVNLATAATTVLTFSGTNTSAWYGTGGNCSTVESGMAFTYFDYPLLQVWGDLQQKPPVGASIYQSIQFTFDPSDQSLSVTQASGSMEQCPLTAYMGRSLFFNCNVGGYTSQIQVNDLSPHSVDFFNVPVGDYSACACAPPCSCQADTHSATFVDTSASVSCLQMQSAVATITSGTMFGQWRYSPDSHLLQYSTKPNFSSPCTCTISARKSILCGSLPGVEISFNCCNQSTAYAEDCP